MHFDEMCVKVKEQRKTKYLDRRLYEMEKSWFKCMTEFTFLSRKRYKITRGCYGTLVGSHR